MPDARIGWTQIRQSNLFVRTCSVLVLAPLVLLTGWLGGWYFFALVLAMASAVQYEWARITRPDWRNWKILVLFGLLATELMLIQIGNVVAALLLALASAALLTVWGLGHRRKAWAGAGHAYAAFFGLSLLALRGDEASGIGALMFIIAVVWSTDIFAYFVGRLLRGPKLWPAISPGKTWSGAIGGLVAGMIAGAIFSRYFVGTSLMYLIVLGAFLSIASQFGDLFESWVKRRFHVKDSGKLIPGHGGVMDRVDGLIFALIFAMCFAYVLGGWQQPGQFLLHGSNSS